MVKDMSRLDYFAGQALVAFLADPNLPKRMNQLGQNPEERQKQLAMSCFELAQAMCAESDKYENK